MSFMKWVPLNKNVFLDKGLSQRANYSFVKTELMVPIFSFELLDAVSQIPLVFKRNNESIQLYGLMGLEENTNLFVDQRGLWRSRFMPAALKSFPFRIVNVKEKGEVMLVLDDESWFDVKSKNNAIFNEDGSHTSLLEGYIKLLRDIRICQTEISKACELMEKFGLLEPFCLTLKNEDGRLRVQGTPTEEGGILRIRTKTFDDLDEKKFNELRKCGALAFIYAHLFSMSALTELLNLMRIDKKVDSNLKDLGAKIFEDQESAVSFNF